MTYWMETMQDDCYIIAGSGWEDGARCRELVPVKDKNNKTVWPEDADIIMGSRRLKSDLIPRNILVQHYFAAEQKAIEQMEANRDAITAQLEELEEEHSGEEGYFADFDKVNKATVSKRLKELQAEKNKPKKEALSMAAEPEVEYGEAAILEQYIQLADKLAESNKKVKDAKTELDKKLIAKYAAINEAEIKQLVVEDKWMTSIEHSVQNEMQRISQRLAHRIKELTERYESTLPDILNQVQELEVKVNTYLTKMGFAWS